MNMEIQQRIGSYLQNYGWKYKIVDNDILLAFQANLSSSDFTMRISINDMWINITVYILLFFNDKLDHELIYKRICFVNYNELVFARLAYSPKTGMTICADLPTNGLNESVFHDMLDVISFYSDKYHEIFSDLLKD